MIRLIPISSARKIVYLLLLVAVPSAIGCADNESYSFRKNMSCSWITKNKKKAAKRRNKWCSRSVSGTLVEEECPVACLKCTPNSVPTPPQTSTPCDDDESFSFKVNLELGGVVSRSCSWITRNEKWTEKRRSEWCTQTANGEIIQEKCPVSCLNCPATPAPTAAPTPQPSKKPSYSPTAAPTSSPTRSNSPTVAPTTSPTRSLSPTIAPSTSSKPTAYATKHPSDVPTVSPSLIPSGVPSDLPTTYPSVPPSIMPSGVPSESPTNVPTQSSKPTRFFSVSPSAKPSSSPTLHCTDTTLQIKTFMRGFKISRNCGWVANRDTVYRCTLVGVSAACPLTCGSCNTCVDPESGRDGLKFEFKNGNGKGIIKDCDWVTRSDTTNRCVQTNDICRASCGVCLA